MFNHILKTVVGDPNRRDIQRYSKIVDKINALEAHFTRLSDADLGAKTGEFRARLAQALAGLGDPAAHRQAEQDALDEILPEAFAAVRAAAIRTVSQRHFEVQLIGGIALHQGKIAEMRTGEGKTLVATLPAYLNALTGRGVHIVTVNDYLARRDARWMAPIYQQLGLTVGVLQEAARTENARKAFLVDFTCDAASEDQLGLRWVDRREAYAADIVYGTNHEFGFDYLRDNRATAVEERVQRERYFAIVDEVDNILIDEARTPLIISGPAEEGGELYYQVAQAVRQLEPAEYEIDERNRGIVLTEGGEAHIERLMGQPLRDPDQPEELSPEQARLLGHLEQALRAEYLFKRDKDYLVEEDKVIIVDEFTGRKMIGRRWSDGLHQAVEAKEGLPVQEGDMTYATVTLQNYFRLYQKLAGMTGTALTEAEEFDKNYKLAVVAIPTNVEYQAMRPESSLVEVEYKEAERKFTGFAVRGDSRRQLVFWRRKDYPDVVYGTEEAKLRAITQEILRHHLVDRPLLVGTSSVELSEHISRRLHPELLQRLAQVLLIRQAWRDKHAGGNDRTAPELAPLAAKLSDLGDPAAAQLMRQLGLSPDPTEGQNPDRLAGLLELPSEIVPKLLAVLRSGIGHNVLNAKKHDEESRIIAGAGAPGAVTIATNMAGRGVDIKLGGDLAEEIIRDVGQVLSRAGVAGAYGLTLEERQAQLHKIPEAQWGSLESECRVFLQMMEAAAQVKKLGGLHVIGSERHEARRIDNQLRGRAARQGDPGSSQFYLSLEDELMRRYGGQPLADLMERLAQVDEAPLKAEVVNRVIEQSQARVERYNFDARKYLLEYDDVLNTQRNTIYGQRDRLFEKDDLTGDFLEMLEAEVRRQVQAAQADEAEGGWKLLAWLEEVQPSILQADSFYPSYMLDILLRELDEKPDKPAVLLDLARAALDSERRHLLATVEAQVEAAESRLAAQARNKHAEAELALEALENAANEGGQPVDGYAAVKAVGEVLALDLQASAEFNLDGFKQQLPALAETSAAQRLQQGLMASLERRLGAAIDMSISLPGEEDWDAIRERLEAAIDKAYEAKIGRALAEIQQELSQSLPAAPSRYDLARALIAMSWGHMIDYDEKHQRVIGEAKRLTYLYLAGERFNPQGTNDLEEIVLDHLHGAYDRLHTLLGPEAFTPYLRQVMLHVIDSLWVDYLTSIEALKVSIGLEAYAQRDPLVAYKAKAFGLFQDLLEKIRAGVVANVFHLFLQTAD